MMLSWGDGKTLVSDYVQKNGLGNFKNEYELWASQWHDYVEEAENIMFE